MPDPAIEHIGFERHADGAALHVVLDRPERKNAISGAMARSIHDAIESAVDDGVRVVVIRSAVEGVFCAGFDIGEMGRSDADPAAPLYALYDALERLPVVTIAAADGLVVGGGVELFLCCDVRLATARSTFRVPPARLSLVYERDGIARYLRRTSHALTSELFLTGRMVAAESAARGGLATRVTTADDWRAVQDDVLAGAPLALRAMKAVIADLARADPATEDAARRFAEARAHVKASDDHREALAAFRERRKPRFTGT